MSAAWRLVVGHGRPGDVPLLPDPEPGPANMALDQALLKSVVAGSPPVLRLYRWSPATLSFGRNQPARGRYDEAAAAARGIAFVRRPTGGQAVLHDDELTYAVIAPVPLVGKPRAAYRRINEALVAGLRKLGVAAAVAGPSGGTVGGPAGASPGSHDWAAACFRRPERGEVVAGGRKLVGSAQRTESRTILQHGSILVGGSQAAAEELLRPPAEVADREGATDAGGPAGGGPSGVSAGGGPSDGGPPVGGPAGGGPASFAADPGWTTLAEELGRRPQLARLAGAVVAGFEEVLGSPLQDAAPTDAEAAAARELQEQFASREWTWRR